MTSTPITSGSVAAQVRRPSASAQHTRVYDEYLAAVSTTDAPRYSAISLVGPRNRVDKIVGKLPLLP
ncbi:DUF2000 family protein [Cellulomonas sp. ICMP 17802]|uniref:DUF2000 family protein n=1 Tax=Cellulomonas sp. ICMP 17802 TaxID=3239199 RepID=UPI00351B9898